MGPAVREKAAKRPPNCMYKPPIWQDEMVEVRETFRRVSCIKASHFTKWGTNFRSGPALSRNRIAKLKNQVPSKSLPTLKHLHTNLSQSPFVSLNHIQNVLGLSRRIQSLSSLTERKKNPHDSQLYPVFIRRPLTARAPLNDQIPYAYTPPRLTLLSKLNLPLSSSRPSSSPLPKLKPGLKSCKLWVTCPSSNNPIAEAPPLSDRSHDRISQSRLSLHRRSHSTEELRHRPPSRCSRRPSPSSSCDTDVSSLSGPDSQSYSNAGSLTPDTSTTNSSRSSSVSHHHCQGALRPPRSLRKTRLQKHRRKSPKKGGRSLGKASASEDKRQSGRFVIPFGDTLPMQERQTAISGDIECFTPKHKVSFATSTPQNNINEQPLHVEGQNQNFSTEASGLPIKENQEAIIQEQQSHVIIKHSADPYVDFKNSMMNLIQTEHLEKNEVELEQLFQYYIDLNPTLPSTILEDVISNVKKELKLIANQD